MAIRQVRKMGDPVLKQVAAPVTDFGPALRILIEDMFDTMHELHGAGLAAPQIGVSLRVMIFEVKANVRYPSAPEVPTTILVNPGYQVVDAGEEEDWEGCLSVPGLRGRVPRVRAIRYWGLDPLKRRVEREVDGFHARVFQHEYDHLDGILYPQRMRDLTSLGFEEVLFAGVALPD